MEYKSYLRKRVKFFEKSRDNWKPKYQQARKEIKSLKNQLYYQQQKHREQEVRLPSLEPENPELKASLEDLKPQRRSEEAQVTKPVLGSK